ncbi:MULTISPECIES: glycosyltransferase family 2 protein [Pseudomonas]|uniref:glycosyltransferase family 2 protein n=1 Tax=Pseudomonas TaxID=286 RepID=UPI000F467340|nr:glycosyltransferase family 2 protein [Pseudomonas protegens]MBS7556925.1 glycosyltransferase family 2 protein [Pseudomonas sp. RC4D1]MDP9503634.1 glycosyltransferase family 2 protein [Pseudomonas protegens]ROL95545.1 glycosyl transferase family 2 [Pseudomonas protegens]ROM01440.1 glycosyl transferase family 2 [Pseudomonas protegens]ROM10035.1 glycosyl transferase family 2 [Pseudomonas protegens]
MNATRNIVILAGTKADEVRPNGEFPHYLSEADGVPLLQSLVDKCANLNPTKIICMLPNADMSKYHLRNMVTQMHPAAVAHPVHDTTKGAACTALLASEIIDSDCELVILSANEILDVSFETIVNQFRTQGRDAGVVIFKSLHPRYAFVRLTDAGDVVEAAEKNPISPHAVAGMYWFTSGAMFVEAVKNMIRKDAKVNDFFYIAPALNELILLHKKIGSYRVEPNQYRPLKSQSQIQAYEVQGSRV